MCNCMASTNYLTATGWLTLFIILEKGSRVCSVEVEATVVTLCYEKLNCWPINSVYRFYISNLKVPARPINTKHILRLLLITVKTSIDVLPSKNQALCKYCTHVSNY